MRRRTGPPRRWLIQGAARVLLFGSLARGTCGPDSDIDLVAIFADLGDYSERRAVRNRLEQAARAAAGHRVDLHVTDFPEWTKRTTEVTASFEASITGETLVLADRELSVTPDWGKEIGLMDNNLDEAGQRFNDTGAHMRELASHLLPDEFRSDGRRIRHRAVPPAPDEAASAGTRPGRSRTP